MHKPRLRRLNILFQPYPLYFVTACTHHRGRWLDNPGVHQCFANFCGGAAERGARVGRYVLMPDHLHLFVALAPESVRLSDWVKSLKNTLSKALRTMGWPAPHWQHGFFDHVMRSAESYQQKWLYVRDNPVRAGLVSQPEGWPYQGEIHRLNFQ
ncbi:MAG TPA: transposase [Terriglobia bacterium]|nr:transposase [Terriglobia bacterium]